MQPVICDAGKPCFQRLPDMITRHGFGTGRILTLDGLEYGAVLGMGLTGVRTVEQV